MTSGVPLYNNEIDGAIFILSKTYEAYDVTCTEIYTQVIVLYKYIRDDIHIVNISHL